MENARKFNRKRRQIEKIGTIETKIENYIWIFKLTVIFQCNCYRRKNWYIFSENICKNIPRWG
jgi:hypothetical protein